MTLGYARISTTDQTHEPQLLRLIDEGCEQVFKDTCSGAREDRPGLDALLAKLRPGDTVIVWRLDRLGRSLKHLIELVEDFSKKGIHLRSLTEGIDTTTPAGKMIFHIFGAVAEFERNLIRERTNAGLDAARRFGRKGGRPNGLSKKAEQTSRIAASLYQEDKLSAADICDQLNISKSTLYRYLRARGVKIGA